MVMLDLSWCGGVSEARRIAGLAEAHHVLIAPHDCTGPVVYGASCHLSLQARSALIQESVRAFYTGWYSEVAEGLPTVDQGSVSVDLSRPGHGVGLLPEVWRRPDAIVRTTGL